MRAGTAGLVVATLACLVPRAAVPRNPEPALIEIEPMTNALAVGEVTRVEDDATFCAFVRGAPCDDPSWFLTSTGREALLAAVTIDNLNGRMTLAYVSFGAPPPPPTGTGVIALIDVLAVGGGKTSLALENVILSDAGELL